MEEHIIPGWEERLGEMSEENIRVSIFWDPLGLTYEEQLRLMPKVRMVQRAARKLMLNMIKGTMKYDVDSWTAEKWMDFAIDDATDTLNYLHLMKDCMAIDKAVQLPLPFENEHLGAGS